MFRTFSFVVLSLFIVSHAHAQTCDPYQSQIRIDYRTYPTPDTSAAFFAALDQGAPVADRTPYVWRYDAAGWYWSCNPLVADQPQPNPERPGFGDGTLIEGRYYQNPYSQIALLSSKDATIPGQPGVFRVFIYVYPTVYCGNIGWSLETNDPVRDSAWREVAEPAIAPGCSPASQSFPEWADPRR